MENEVIDYEYIYDWLGLNDFLLPNKEKLMLHQLVVVCNGIKVKMTRASNAFEKGIIKLILEQYPVMKKVGDQMAETYARNCWIDTELSIEFFIQKIIDDGPFDNKTQSLIKDISQDVRKSPVILKPKLLKVSEKPEGSYLSKTQWKKKCNIHNQNSLQKYRFHKKRMDEFIKTTHKILIKHFPEIKKFSPDQMKDYDSLLMERFRVYRFSCEQQQLIIDYDLDESFIHRSKKELTKIIGKLSTEIRAEVKDINRRRMLGERI